MAKKVKKYQPGGPTFPASASRFMDAPAKPKPTSAPVKKETRGERKAKQEAERLRLQEFDKKQPRLQGVWIPENSTKPVKKTGGAVKSKKKK